MDTSISRYVDSPLHCFAQLDPGNEVVCSFARGLLARHGFNVVL